ncbi:hypothetical protein [Pseudoalteromonas luteoviolacea]|uniref:hypothetical protein n=1 Tax=Pseudoalteromonas luteoviolacea TaxID=43657 RepID=UPI00115262BF|nr:hypothetical protein [Pseudoalteromonas luteoviolacea]TQF70322.1 hypothetical protein FLM44_04300 [Pseudoalteromonas luteoviolacea]
MMKTKLFLMLLGLTMSQFSYASSVERSSKGVIKNLISYADYGNGDVFISLPTNGATCSYGYYVNKNSAGFQANLSMLLAAYHSQTPVYIHGFTAESKRWTGSKNPVCEVYSVQFER